MNLFAGLYFYEIVLLVLGIVLFLTMLVALIVSLLKGNSIAPLVMFFVISIVMIAFPSIAKVRFDEHGVEIDKATNEVVQNPSNPQAKAKLQNLLATSTDRANSSPQRLLEIARAQAALGKKESALQNVDQALKIDPRLNAAKDLKGRLESVPASNNPALLRRAVQENKTSPR
jgi:hypothetical protein